MSSFKVRFDVSATSQAARELHDTLLQDYLSASLQAQAAFGRLDASSPARQPLNRAIELMAKVSAESRAVLRELRSSEPDETTLEEAFSGVPAELAVSSGVRFVITTEGRPRSLSPALRNDVYRIGREAIVNAFTHSGGTEIDVETEFKPNSFRLLIQDNGRGMDQRLLQTGREGHWGLRGMRERAERIGGKLSVRSSVGAGAEIDLAIPADLAFDSGSAAKTRWFHRVLGFAPQRARRP